MSRLLPHPAPLPPPARSTPGQPSQFPPCHATLAHPRCLHPHPPSRRGAARQPAGSARSAGWEQAPCGDKVQDRPPGGSRRGRSAAPAAACPAGCLAPPKPCRAVSAHCSAALAAEQLLLLGCWRLPAPATNTAAHLAAGRLGRLGLPLLPLLLAALLLLRVAGRHQAHGGGLAPCRVPERGGPALHGCHYDMGPGRQAPPGNQITPQQPPTFRLVVKLLVIVLLPSPPAATAPAPPSAPAPCHDVKCGWW